MTDAAPTDPDLTETFAWIDSLETESTEEFDDGLRCGFMTGTAVLDTNVLLDLWYWNDPEAQYLKNQVQEGRLVLLSSPSCMKEFAVVLARPQFGLAPDAQRAFLENVYEYTVLLTTSGESRVRCRDAEDEKFLNLAYEARADFLFTKDKMVLKAGPYIWESGTHILQPEDFQGD